MLYILTLLFAVMMVFSRLDDATHHQVCKKSSIKSELPQVKYWLPPPWWSFYRFCSLLQYWSLFLLINQMHSSKKKCYHLPCPVVPSPPSSHSNLNHNPENDTGRLKKTTQNLYNDHSWSTQKQGGEQERKQRSQRIKSWVNKCNNSKTKERKNKTKNHAMDAHARTAKWRRRRQISNTKGKRRHRP